MKLNLRSSLSRFMSSTGVNRLAGQKSPYLLQHKTNPVDWYPWGDEAIVKAREEDKPILLSIGYSTCHWCHVMERESFENVDIASLMNESFVSIKVDREERPDIDRQYMTFVQALNGTGGWPLTVFLSPDLIPFFGGTYFPPIDMHGQAGFSSILRIIASKWKTDKAALMESGKAIVTTIQNAVIPKSQPFEAEESDIIYKECIEEVLKHFEGTFDSAYGGFGGAPKFPTVPNLSFLLRLATCNEYSLEARRKAQEMVFKTLEGIGKGGIHDHIEGGFHRYSVDRTWHLPHFEKMLYDQGQLMNVFSTAYALNPTPTFKVAVNGIYNYVTNHLAHPQGAFYCAEDADSKPSQSDEHKKEGAFALWSYEKLKKLLPAKNFDAFCAHFGVKPEGNIDPSKDPHGEMTGLNVLDTLNVKNNHSSVVPHLETEELLAEARRLAATKRSERPRPSLDSKILAGWNGLMISGLCKAYLAFGLNKRYLETAKKSCQFIIENMNNEPLKRSFASDIDAFPDDYAYFIQALLDIYHVTLDSKYLDVAKKLQSQFNNHFWDDSVGAYLTSPLGSSQLPMKLVDDYDGAEPSANSVAAMNLIRLSLLLDDPSYSDRAQRLFQTFAESIQNTPFRMTALLEAKLYAPDLAVINAPDLQSTEELLNAALSSYHPSLCIKGNIDANLTKANAHVCKGTSCSEPVNCPEALSKLLRQ